jgi:lysophospholipase L1-like esterase
MQKAGYNSLLRVAMALCDSAILVLLCLLPLLWIFAPLKVALGARHVTLVWHIWWYLLPALLFAARQGLKKWAAGRDLHPAALCEQGWFPPLAFGLLVTFLFFDVFEVVLTRIDFSVQLPQVIFEGKDAQGKLNIADVVNDPVLLWRFQPGSTFNGRKINRMGFREREMEPVKPAGTVRVICLGDSVTAQGRPGYAELLNRLLADQPPTSNRWEAFNMGVYGYSVAQGLMQFRLTKDRVRPDIVTLYFGWNDHWRNNLTDYQQMAQELRPFAGHLMDALRLKRFYQFTMWATDKQGHIQPRESSAKFHFTHTSENAHNEAWDTSVLRVPPQEYHDLLFRFIREIRAANAIPVLLTAPRRHLSATLVEKHHAHTVAEAEQLHDQYVAITRTVALEGHAELLDLAALMADPACDAFFRPDGIHFDYCEQEGNMLNDPPTQPGLQRIAAELDQKIRAITRSPAWQEQQRIGAKWQQQ